MLKAHLRVLAGVGLLALGAVACQGPSEPAAPAKEAAKAEEKAPAPPPQKAAPIPPDPSTQEPAHLVTADQMLKWEKELSNWGRWGKEDEKGTLNLLTPAKAKAAVALVKEGITVSLHHFPDLEKAIDTGNMNAETKHFMTAIDPKTGRVRGALDGISFALHDGGHTHMDALCHYAVQSIKEGPPQVFNGQIQGLSEKGCEKDTIDHMGKAYITRGVLIDMPLLKKVDWLPNKTPLYVADIEAWEKFANVKIQPGDVVLLRVGRWAKRAKEGPWNYARENPGFHASVLPWLHQRDPAVIVGEGVADAQPSGVEGWPRPIHDISIPIFGTPLVDNGYMEELAATAAKLKRWEFMVSWTMIQIPQGTATPWTAQATF